MAKKGKPRGKKKSPPVGVTHQPVTHGGKRKKKKKKNGGGPTQM